MPEVLEYPTWRDLIHHYPRAASAPGTLAPEARTVYGGIGWDGYLEWDEALGHDRPNPRFYYLDGDLEIVSTSDEHERIKKRLANCMAILFEVRETRDFARGQATMRIVEEAGAEPDESWCFGEEKRFPDVVLEIALTSGGLPKLEIYARFRVAEVWFWRRGRLEFFRWQSATSSYEPAATSRLVPNLPIAALAAAVEERDPILARRAFRAAL